MPRDELPAYLSRGKFRRRRQACRLAVLPRARCSAKTAAFFVLDSHAGRGFYDLQAPEAQKSGEAERGVQRLIVNGLDAEPLSPLLRGDPRAARQTPRALSGLAGIDRGRLAPAGSRAVRRARCRPRLAPPSGEIESLGRVRTEIGDGYAALKAFLPPEERRGLVLIDPPYESLDELKQMLQAFADAYRRWPSGMYLMWYPIRSATQRSAGACALRGAGNSENAVRGSRHPSGRCRIRARGQRADDRESALRRG